MLTLLWRVHIFLGVSDLVLYSYFRSSASFRVRIALKWKELPYEYKAIHLLKDGGQQNAGFYKELNPIGEVPTLVDEGRVISQSMAIIQYIDQKWPQKKLFPEDLFTRAKVVQFCEMINASIQPLQNLRVLQELEKRFGADQAAKDNWTIYFIERGLMSLEKFVEAFSGTYCFGNSVTAAECFLIPQMFSSRRFKVDVSKYPKLLQVEEACMKLKAFKEAHPSQQPDAE